MIIILLEFYGFDPVPWVSNASFKVNSKLLDKEVMIYLPRSMSHKATTPDPATTPWVNNEATGKLYAYKNILFHMDRYGYCCEGNLLWHPVL